MNTGNFLEIMEILSETDPVVKAHLSSKNTKYTSPTIQNETIGIMAMNLINSQSGTPLWLMSLSTLVGKSRCRLL